MKILIFGATGQLGFECVNIFKAEDFDVSITTCDISKIKDVKKAIKLVKPNIILNCAAYTNVSESENNLQEAFAVNHKGAKNISRIANELQCKVIHISTDYVFDGTKTIPYIESDDPNPKTTYGESKLFGEQEVLSINKNNTVVRTSGLYSPIRNNFFKSIIHVIYKHRIVQIVDNQFTTPTWSYSLAYQLISIIKNNLTGIIHATPEGYSSWYNITEYFLYKLGLTNKIIPGKLHEYNKFTQVERPAFTVLENKVLKQNRLSIFTHWEDDLDLFINLYKTDFLKILKQ